MTGGEAEPGCLGRSRLEEGEEVGGAWGFFEDAGGEDGSAAVVMERDGEGENAPGELLLVGAGMIEQAAAGAIDVGLAAVADGLDDFVPVAHDGLQLLKDAAADEPVAGMAEVFGGSVVAVLPDAVFVEDLYEDVGADGEREAGVEEVAGVDDDGSAAAFGSEGAEGIEEIFDGAVAFEQMHVFDAAEEAVERGGEDDDGNVRTAATQESSYLGAELTMAEVIVEDGDVDVVEKFGRLFDGRSGDTLIAVLAKDGGAENEIVGLVVEQEDAYWLGVPVWHQVKGAWDTVGRLNHCLTSSF
jgi:hypothetical protein